jgi:hypothetical protein
MLFSLENVPICGVGETIFRNAWGSISNTICKFNHARMLYTGAGIKDMERNVAANQKMLTAFFPSACV